MILTKKATKTQEVSDPLRKEGEEYRPMGVPDISIQELENMAWNGLV